MTVRRRLREHTVAVLVTPPVEPFELALVCEVFGRDRRYLADPWYRMLLCSAGSAPVAGAIDGLTIACDHDLDDLARADTVIVTPYPDSSGPVAADVIGAIRTAHRRGARLVSICTGAFVLAAAGVLDGLRATTHWLHTDELAARYPAINVDRDVLYVDEGRVLTSAGSAAGMDLCLHIVRLDHGAEAANTLARRLVVPPHRDGGQAQYVEAPVPEADGVTPMAATLDWAIAHLDRPLTVEDLARRTFMSPRTFARRFRESTGTTPLQWLLRQRIVLAKRLLETGDTSVDLIAVHCGFGSATAMRTHFRRQVGISPIAYRRTFRREVS
jgi:transcriptional regulator GlxA family with amidase domain